MEIHIGKVILEKLKEQDISKSEFGRKINRSRQNVQDIFKRESIDTNLLAEVSKVLNFDFFQYLSKNKEVSTSILMEDIPSYKKSEVDKYKQKAAELNKELKQAQKELAYLKKINALLEKKAERKK